MSQERLEGEGKPGVDSEVHPIARGLLAMVRLFKEDCIAKGMEIEAGVFEAYERRTLEKFPPIPDIS